jgi:hypothetical protein
MVFLLYMQQQMQVFHHYNLQSKLDVNMLLVES